MSLWLRPAEPMDAAAVAAILGAFVDQTPWMPRLHSRAEDIAHCGQMIDRGWVTIAMTADRVAGFLARDGDEINSLYIAPGSRRQGVGRQLIEDAKAQVDRLVLWTFVANVGALRFYDRMGFVELSRGTGAGNEEGLLDVQLAWTRGSTA